MTSDRGAGDPASMGVGPDVLPEPVAKFEMGAFATLCRAIAVPVTVLTPRSRARYGAYDGSVRKKLTSQLCFAARTGDLDALRSALAKGAPLDIVWRDDAATPLGYACMSNTNSGQIVRALLAVGADPAMPFSLNRCEFVPIQKALCVGHWEAALALLERLPETAVDRNLLEWLAEGCSHVGSVERSKELPALRAVWEWVGAMSNPMLFGRMEGRTALAELCVPNIEAIEMFARLGSDPCEINDAGYCGSALRAAVAKSSVACTRRLLEMGADPLVAISAKCSTVNPETPLQWLARAELAKKPGKMGVSEAGSWRELVQVLLSAGAKLSDLDAVASEHTRRVLGILPRAEPKVSGAWGEAIDETGVNPDEKVPAAGNSLRRLRG